MQEDATTVVAQREAAAWFVANRDPTEAAERAEEFIAWLRASPLHVREYLAAAELARLLGGAAAKSVHELVAEALAAEAADVVVLPSARATAPVHARPRPAADSRGRFAYALAASLLVGIAGLFAYRAVVAPAPDGQRAADARYRTEHGEQRTFTLVDGSVIHLNSESEVSLHFDAHARLVELRAGQALFDVAKDPSRPFRVRAGDTEVRAVGTQFEVYRRADATVVTVVEGKVAVSTPPAAGEGPQARSVPLVAGQRLRVPLVPLESPVSTVHEPESVDARATVAWSHREFVFDSQPLGEVVAELNRYSPKRIVVDDADLAQRRISGVFDVYDSASFLEFLRRIDRVSVTPGDGTVHVTIAGEDAGTR